ncbi:MAG: bifunctional phosphoribosylaminoimidazolecarboxamide formyltransferase/IMP cyclohydrolase [Planctomycetota bacterium]
MPSDPAEPGIGGEPKRALLSVSDKSGVAEFAAQLDRLGFEIISTGGTARAIEDAGTAVTPVDQITGFPEMLDGRVKTLHPMVHGGLLGVRSHPEHRRTMQAHGIGPIDLVAIDLYPFESTIARDGTTRDEAIEQIDIGGPAMIRSAAKNHASVAVITDPADYGRVIDSLHAGNADAALALRRSLAAKAFARTCAYDAAIASYLADAEDGSDPLPERITVALSRREVLRYGENPHQQAAVYTDGRAGGGVLDAEQLHGKPLSYNNIADAAAAWALACTLGRIEPDLASAVIVKHANPCGAAVAPDPALAADGAFAGDPIAAFGGIMACHATLTAPAAERLCEEGVFLEVIVAGGFEPAAADRLRDRWKNLRILVGTRPAPEPRLIRLVPGGALVQTPDDVVEEHAWHHAAGPSAESTTIRAARVIEAIAQALASNAVAIGGPDAERPGCVRLFGAGAGQMDRLTACRLASEKAGESARNAIAVSDAFFPFNDGPALLADTGVRTIVHPGGSKRDQETFELCEERAISCLTTGIRRFRHEPLR